MCYNERKTLAMVVLIGMLNHDIINFRKWIIIVVLLSVFIAIGVPKRKAFGETRAECNPKYEECIKSCGKQQNSCYESAGTDTDQIARCDDQYTTCDKECYAKFCWGVKEEKSE